MFIKKTVVSELQLETCNSGEPQASLGKTTKERKIFYKGEE